MVYFAIVLIVFVLVVFVLVLNKEKQNFLPVSSIIHAGLFRDLTLGVSHDNYHSYRTASFFKGSRGTTTQLASTGKFLRLTQSTI